MTLEAIEGVRVAAGELKPFLMEIFRRAGADEPSAAAVSTALTDASARAFDTHGIRLVPFYMQGLDGGRINKAPRIEVARKAAAIAHVDADNGLGHLASYRAIEAGCAIASEAGVAVVTVGNSSHHGATGCYTRLAATQGFAAIGMTHADSMVIPFGGTRAFFGTNPFSFALPVPGEDPLLLDMATSTIPFNRVGLRQATGTPLPEEVAVDRDGAFTTDPFAAVAVGPVGGAVFGYKGSGLAAMVDLLCSAFTGMGHGRSLASFGGPDFSVPIPIGHFFIIMAPALFEGFAAFDDRISAFLADLRAQPAKSDGAVHAPGDIEKREAERRRTEGLPVDPVTWAAFGTYAERFGCPLPPVLGR